MKYCMLFNLLIPDLAERLQKPEQTTRDLDVGKHPALKKESGRSVRAHKKSRKR